MGSGGQTRNREERSDEGRASRSRDLAARDGGKAINASQTLDLAVMHPKAMGKATHTSQILHLAVMRSNGEVQNQSSPSPARYG